MCLLHTIFRQIFCSALNMHTLWRARFAHNSPSAPRVSLYAITQLYLSISLSAAPFPSRPPGVLYSICAMRALCLVDHRIAYIILSSWVVFGTVRVGLIKHREWGVENASEIGGAFWHPANSAPAISWSIVVVVCRLVYKKDVYWRAILSCIYWNFVYIYTIILYILPHTMICLIRSRSSASVEPNTGVWWPDNIHIYTRWMLYGARFIEHNFLYKPSQQCA